MPDIAAPSAAAPHYPWWILPGLAAMVLVVFAGALAASCMLDDNTLRTQMFTGAYGLATLSMGYFFGSSAGSAKKDDAAAADSAKKTEALAGAAPAMPMVTTTTVDPGPPATATTTTAPADPAPTIPSTPESRP